MKLFSSPLPFLLLVTSFAACSPSEGGSGSNDTSDGGTSPGGVSGSGQGGTPATGGTPALGGSPAAGGTPSTGGGSGTGLGGTAGAPPTGGTAGVAGTAGNAGTSAGGAAGAGVGGTAGDAGASGTAGDAGAPTGGTGGSSGGGAYTGTIIVQDDFNAQANAAAPDSAKWQLYPDYAPAQQPIIDSTRSHTPPNAAKTRGQPSFLIPKEAAVLGGTIAPSNKFYVRVWVNFEKATAAIGNHSTFLVGSVAKDNSGTELRLGFSSNQSGKPEMLDLNLQNPSDGGGEVTRYSNGFTDGGNPGNFSGMGVQFAANQWYCLEALFDGGGSEFRLWVNDVENMEMHVHDFSGTGMAGRTSWGPMFKYLKIGVQDYSGQIGQVWYDDVFVGTTPIGCQR